MQALYQLNVKFVHDTVTIGATGIRVPRDKLFDILPYDLCRLEFEAICDDFNPQ